MTTAEIVFSLDRSLPNLVWLITLATPTHTPFFVEFGWVENSPRLFVVSPFSCTRLEKKSVNGGARTSTQNAWNQPIICLLETSTQMPLTIAHKFQKFALQKPFFAQNTHKSWRNCHQKFLVKTALGNFKLWVKNSTGSRIRAVALHAQQKIG